MRLDDRIGNIYSELSLQLYNEQQANWLAGQFNAALVRARKLEDMAEAIEKALEKKQNPRNLDETEGFE